MNARKYFHFLLAFLFSLALVAAWSAPVLAAPEPAKRKPPAPPADTKIYLMPPSRKELGQSFILISTLKDDKGVPIANRNVAFYMDGNYIGQGKTQDNGIATLTVKNDFMAGKYRISVYFKGSHEFAQAATSTTLEIQPTTVYLQTVPPVEGILFQLDGRHFQSGPDGLAEIKIFKPGQYRLSVLTEQYSAEDKRIEFGRWANESYEPYQDIQIPTNGVIQVGLNIYHQVSQTFVDLDGLPVDPSRISGITIKSAQGDVFNFADGQPRWLPSSRIARRITGLEETKLLYSVMAVSVDGSNVVNQAQQRFFADPNDQWTISLLLYSMNVTARDALFGSPVGQRIALEFPNGKVETYKLDSSGMAQVHSLARGIYQIQVTGVQGISSRTPVALSRNQDVALKVITVLDMSVVGGLAAVVALGLLLFGRPWLLHMLVKRRKVLPVGETSPQPVAVQEQSWMEIHDN